MRTLPPPVREGPAPARPPRGPRVRGSDRPSRPPAPGTTLPELLVATTLLALLAGLVTHAAARIADRERVRAAADELRGALAHARALAVQRAEVAAVRLDTVAHAVTVHVRADSALQRPLGRLYGVRLAATRDSTAFGGTGLGHGAANLRAIVRRGARAETVWVSRLGRVR